MKVTLENTTTILSRTPTILCDLLSGMPDGFIMHNEGEGTWNVPDVLGHLIHCEKSDWVPRLEIILSEKTSKAFTPVDRTAQFKMPARNLDDLLDEFMQLRSKSIKTLSALQLTDLSFLKTGIHPEFGTVTLSQLLSTWAVHDLTHINQITRIIAKQYKDEVGPWIAYLSILKSQVLQ